MSRFAYRYLMGKDWTHQIFFLGHYWGTPKEAAARCIHLSPWAEVPNTFAAKFADKGPGVQLLKVDLHAVRLEGNEVKWRELAGVKYPHVHGVITLPCVEWFFDVDTDTMETNLHYMFYI